MGGSTSGAYEDDARLYIYTPTTDTWDTPIETPVYCFGLTTYRSQLVLVGGRVCKSKSSDNITDKLWTLNKLYQWQDTLPPMRTKRHSVCAASFVDQLLVAGGCIQHQGSVNIVEVFDGKYWLFAQSLPKRYDCLKSVILNQRWYLMGGYVDLMSWSTMVHHISLESLTASCQSSETKTIQPSSDVWKTLIDVPHPASGSGVFHSRLITVGGGEEDDLTSNIYTYSFQTDTWIHIGEMPFRSCQTSPVVLPGTGELLVIGGDDGKRLIKTVLKASIKGNLCRVHMIALLLLS
jgi:N-acetylneuraminic acid mutarotase